MGWSIPVVSRFEAGKEVPDATTHRRYCALVLPRSCGNVLRMRSGGLTPDKEA